MKIFASLFNMIKNFRLSAAAEDAVEAVEKISIDFNVERFLDSFQYMGIGMLCIFIVIGAIILVIMGLTAVMNAMKKRQT